MQMIADLHTHTLCATHAFQTLNEMAAAAKDCGYKALAITDHAPAMPDAPHIWHFENLTALPRTIDECGLCSMGPRPTWWTPKASWTCRRRILAVIRIGWCASIHSPCVPGLLTRKEANRIWLAVAENPYVDCIGHSEQENYRYDYDLVTKAFAANHKVVELNGNSVQRPQGRHPQHESPAGRLPAKRLPYRAWTVMPTAPGSLRHGLTASLRHAGGD